MKSLVIILFATFCFNVSIFSFPANDTIVVQDTVYDYLERSADGVFHVANTPSEPDVYKKYFFGTNENYTEISQHFDYPEPVTDSAEIVKVELLGFRVQIAVNQVMGGTSDSLTFHYYNTDSLGFPEGTPLASGKFLSEGVGNTSRDYFFSGNDGIEITGMNGFALGFETFDQNPGGIDDIFVMSNSYCVVQGGPNDGRGERRTKVKFVADNQWHDILDFASFADCDAYVFPFLKITEVIFMEEPTAAMEAPAFDYNAIFPNPASESLNIRINNPKGTHINLLITNTDGKRVSFKYLGNENKINCNISISDLSAGVYYLTLQDESTKISEPIVITR